MFLMNNSSFSSSFCNTFRPLRVVEEALTSPGTDPLHCSHRPARSPTCSHDSSHPLFPWKPHRNQTSVQWKRIYLRKTNFFFTNFVSVHIPYYTMGGGGWTNDYALAKC